MGTPSRGYTGRHLPYGITQCYLPPDTSERARLTPTCAQRNKHNQLLPLKLTEVTPQSYIKDHYSIPEKLK